MSTVPKFGWRFILADQMPDDYALATTEHGDGFRVNYHNPEGSTVRIKYFTNIKDAVQFHQMIRDPRIIDEVELWKPYFNPAGKEVK